MTHALIMSKIRAFAHRRLALSALRANSSLSVRLTRYNTHMTIARTLNAIGGCCTTLPAQSSSACLEDIHDVQGILVVLAMALTVIASPATPVVCSRVLAVVAQHTAIAWAELLDDVIRSTGGEQ